MKRLVIKTGEYPDKNDSSKMKGEYVRLGVIMDGTNGEYVLLDPSVNLAGCLIKQRVMNAGKQNTGKGDMVMCSIFTDEPQHQPAPQQQDQHNQAKSDGYQPAPQGGDDFSDDIYFSPVNGMYV
jgi:hypothetical protein